MKFIISSAVLALVGATNLSKKSFLRDSVPSKKLNSTVTIDDEDDTLGLSDMQDKALSVGVLSGLT